MQIRVREVADVDMPDGYDWAVVEMGKETWLLTREHPDVATVNMALAEVHGA